MLVKTQCEVLGLKSGTVMVESLNQMEQPDIMKHGNGVWTVRLWT